MLAPAERGQRRAVLLGQPLRQARCQRRYALRGAAACLGLVATQRQQSARAVVGALRAERHQQRLRLLRWSALSATPRAGGGEREWRTWVANFMSAEKRPRSSSADTAAYLWRCVSGLRAARAEHSLLGLAEVAQHGDHLLAQVLCLLGAPYHAQPARRAARVSVAAHSSARACMRERTHSGRKSCATSGLVGARLTSVSTRSTARSLKFRSCSLASAHARVQHAR